MKNKISQYLVEIIFITVMIFVSGFIIKNAVLYSSQEYVFDDNMFLEDLKKEKCDYSHYKNKDLSKLKKISCLEANKEVL